MTDHVQVRRGVYADSVSLMQVSQRVRATGGVTAALVAMATELNVGLLTDLGFELPDGTGANDLVVAIRADDDAALDAGREALEIALRELRDASAGSGGFGAADPPRTTRAAATRAGDATIALVSVPGAHAYAEARDAIDAGLSVMVFSDNVPLEQEVSLKAAAAQAGVLVMGPDCGTAVVGGVALGFANRVNAGPVGVVAASGTGAQQVMCLLDAAGLGVSHCLGLGGRDLTAEVGGASARRALAAFAADETTETVLLVSKPAAPGVVTELDELARDLGVDLHWATLGEGRANLTASVEAFLRARGHDVPKWPAWPASPRTAAPAPAGSGRRLSGLFCGGTLADETRIIAGAGHTVVDFGDDEMTQGRPHPMIDPTLRLAAVERAAADPEVGVVLLDLVLGHGAHPDPAPELANAIRSARRGRGVPVVVTLVGTPADPQGLEDCARRLTEAGADVFASNAAATRHALSLVGKDA